MTRPLTVALAGLGTVGAGVLKLLRDNAEIVTARAGRPIAVTAVSARNRLKDRGIAVSGLHWYEDPVALASYASDSHGVSFFLNEKGQLCREKGFFVRTGIFPVSYRSIRPPRESCENLLVPTCVSA